MMRRTRLLPFAAFAGVCTPALTVLAALGASACSSSSSPATGSDSGSPTTDGGPAPSGDGGLVVTPASGNVLTCASLLLTETGGKGGGTWSVAPTAGAGSVSMVGDYSAPTVSPGEDGGAAPVTVTYAEGAASASANLQVATAFLGSAHSVPVTTADALEGAPFEHQFAASGSHVYGAFLSSGDGGEEMLYADIFASSDNGATFTAPTAYHTGNATCATLAIDAADPTVVYLAYYAGHGDSSSNTGGTLRLAVSTDAAKTFPVEYVIGDSDNSIASFICPDVSSPAANQVIVAAVVAGDTSSHVGTFISGNKGAGIGPAAAPGTAQSPNPDGGIYAPTDTNAASASTCVIHSNSGSSGPRVVSNGKGTACIVYQYDFGCDLKDNAIVQCSQDNGATWTAPTAFGAVSADTTFYPTGAVSPSGKVAVSWANAVTTDAGASDIGTYIAFSTDKGTTFGAPVLYPLAAQDATGGTDGPFVAWENDTVLWLARTGNIGNFSTIALDKTCDDGATWSGAVLGASDAPTSLFLTGSGMMVAAYNTHNHLASTYSLTGN